MSRRLITLAALALCITAPGLAPAATAVQYQEAKTAKAAPAATGVLLKKAQASAKANGKNVLLIFHASWCKWCHRLDAFMADQRVKSIFEENFVPLRVTVLESDDKKADENPGGMEVMTALGGAKAGLPFFAILDAAGRPVISSIRPSAGEDGGGNTGFPAAPEEIDHFLKMLRAGAPKITGTQLELIKQVLSEKPSSAGG